MAKGASAGYCQGRRPKVGSRSRRQASIAGERSPLELDRLIHERLRLGIISALAVNERLTFNDLKRLLQTTDGNLSVHARKLEEAAVHRLRQDVRMPASQTEYRLTAAGRRAFEKYLSHMEAIIKAVRD